MSNPVYPIKKVPVVTSIKTLVTEYADLTIAPEEFQRPLAWSNTDKERYFNSILMDRLEGSFVFVDLVSATKKLQSLDPGNRAYDFFKSLRNKSKKYIILDANNRLNTLKSLIRDDWTIPNNNEYIYLFGDKVETFKVTSANNKFSKLPEEVKNEILKRSVTVSEYTQIDYKGLSEVFLNVNSGQPLKEQEKRNAYGTEWADYVREVRNENMPFLKMIHPNPMKRLHGDNWIANVLCFARGITEDEIYGIEEITKDALYRSPFSRTDYVDEDGVLNKGTDYYSDKFAQLGRYIATMKKQGTPGATRPGTCLNLFWMMCNGIDTYEQAVNAVILHEELYNSRTTNERGRTFKWACGCLGMENNAIRMIEVPAIVEEVLVQTPV